MKRPFIKTFGYFDVFVDGQPVIFQNAKEKELLAILVDREGGSVNPASAMAYLYEETVIDQKIKNQFRKLGMNLAKTLEKYGIAHILSNNHGIRNLNREEVECDYYGLLDGDEKYERLFRGSYMTQYSWAEMTLADLQIMIDRIDHRRSITQ